MLIYFTCL